MCGNGGLQYAVFHNDQGASSASYYTTYNPEYMKSPTFGGQGTSNLYYSSATTRLGAFYKSCPASGAEISVYPGGRPVQCNFFSINHRGYLHATKTGSYRIDVHDIDDIFLLWTGPNAYSS